MLATIGRALDRGLDSAHLARALQRVIDDGEVERHCEVVRAAVRQAWADQRAGMCAGCGADPGQHLVGCVVRAAEADAAGEDEAKVSAIDHRQPCRGVGVGGWRRAAGWPSGSCAAARRWVTS